MAREMLGPILVSLHNIAFYQRLLRQARAAIEAGSFGDFLEEKRATWSRTTMEDEDELENRSS